MYPGTTAVYGPGLELLKSLNAQSANSLNQTLGQTRGAFENSVADIAAQQQKQGVNFKGFTQPEYDRYFGSNALPALQGLEAGVADTNLQLANVLNQLITERGRTGYDYGEKRQGRIQDRRLTSQELAQQERINKRELSTEEQLTRARLAAETQAAQIQASRSGGGYGGSGGIDPEGIDAYINTNRGGDGKINPETYHQAMAQWLESGGSENSFHNRYRNYVNTKHAEDYYDIENFIAKKRSDAMKKKYSYSPTSGRGKALPGMPSF